VIVQSDDFNETEINTVIGVIVTSNLRLAAMPGNVLIRSAISGLRQDSVVNVTQVVTIDQIDLTDFVSFVDDRSMEAIDAGLRLVLSL
jgi:mRNA interferase MazF